MHQLANLMALNTMKSTPVYPTAAWPACLFLSFKNISNITFPKLSFCFFPLCIFYSLLHFSSWNKILSLILSFSLLHSHSIHQQILLILPPKISTIQHFSPPHRSQPLLFLSWTFAPTHQRPLCPP